MTVTANDAYNGYKSRLMLSGVTPLTYWCGLVSSNVLLLSCSVLDLFFN